MWSRGEGAGVYRMRQELEKVVLVERVRPRGLTLEQLAQRQEEEREAWIRSAVRALLNRRRGKAPKEVCGG
jgi:hypothetical protein